MPNLLHITEKCVARMFKDKNDEEVKAHFGIEEEFTKEEEAKLIAEMPCVTKVLDPNDFIRGESDDDETSQEEEKTGKSESENSESGSGEEEEDE